MTTSQKGTLTGCVSENRIGNYLLLFGLLNSHAKFADKQSIDYST